jgi:hypothetical protein
VFNVKLLLFFNLLFIVIFSFQNNLQKQTIIFDFKLSTNYKYKKNIKINIFKIKNNVLKLK